MSGCTHMPVVWIRMPVRWHMSFLGERKEEEEREKTSIVWERIHACSQYRHLVEQLAQRHVRVFVAACLGTECVAACHGTHRWRRRLSKTRAPGGTSRRPASNQAWRARLHVFCQDWRLQVWRDVQVQPSTGDVRNRWQPEPRWLVLADGPRD